MIAPGASLLHYRIVEKLGEGGMGSVWRASDSTLDRDVAIKVLPADFAANAERLARFEREAKVLASLNHPNIGAIYGFHEANGVRFLAMELVPGEDLAHRLEKGTVPFSEAVDMARQIAGALEYAHERGVVHRDLKPANVKITPDGTVKVLDFGLAKAVAGDATVSGPTSTPTILPTMTSAGTAMGMILGTAAYMSPEQARGKPVDKRADIWAFGVVLFEMFAGKRLFDGETVSDTLAAVLTRPVELDALPRSVPAPLRRLIARCLERDAKQRLRDIGEARIELQSPMVEPAQDELQPGGAPDGRGITGREVLAWSLLALVALGAGGVWLASSRQRVHPGLSAFRQLNIRSEAIFRAAFAPDGKTVVYSAAGSGNNPELLVVRPESPEPQPLGLKRTQLLSVSSKGDLAVLTDPTFLGHRLFDGTLARVSIAGGTPRQLLEHVREADWARDGERLAIIREVNGKDRLEFPVGNALRETSGYFSDLRFNPAGDRIAYFEHPWKYDDRGSVNVTDLKGASIMLADGYWGMEGIAWSQDGSEVFYSANASGVLSVYAVKQGAAPRVVYPLPGNTTIQDISRDGNWLITQDTYFDGIMVRAPGSEREIEVAWLDWSWGGGLSADGRTVAFTNGSSIMGPNYGVCVRGTDGSPVQRLGEGGLLDLSRDGKWVLAQIPTTPPALIAYPVGPGDPVRFERASLDTYAAGEWFRDGSRVVVNAAEPGKGMRFYIQDFKAGGSGGAPRAVTPEGTRFGRLSPDDRSILARGPNGEYAIFPIDGGSARPVKGLKLDDALIAWCVDGRSVVASRWGPVPSEVERVDLESGKRSPLRTLAPTDLSGVTSVTPLFFSDDLKSYLYDYERSTSKLFVAEAHR